MEKANESESEIGRLHRYLANDLKRNPVLFRGESVVIESPVSMAIRNLKELEIENERFREMLEKCLRVFGTEIDLSGTGSDNSDYLRAQSMVKQIKGVFGKQGNG